MIFLVIIGALVTLYGLVHLIIRKTTTEDSLLGSAVRMIPIEVPAVIFVAGLGMLIGGLFGL